MSLFAIQREVFGSDERLLTAVVVAKPGKPNRKGKVTILCLTVQQKQDTVRIHKVKASGTEHFDKRRSWALGELKQVDGVHIKKKDFVLHFDKPFRWIASDLTEKSAFLFALSTLCHKYLDGGPTFVNWSTASKQKENDGDATAIEGDLAVTSPTEPEDNKELTVDEERDITEVLSSCDWGVSDAEAFQQRLTDELTALEAANIHAIVQSEEQVNALMNELDATLEALEILDQKISSYDNAIKNVRKDVVRVAEQDTQMKTQTTNLTKLQADLHLLVSSMDLAPEHVNALQDADLGTKPGLRMAIEAALALQRCLNLSVSPGLSQLDAVQKRTKAFNLLQDSFANRFLKHFKVLVVDLSRERPETKGASLKLHDHHERIDELLQLAPLMKWLHDLDPVSRFSRFSSMCQVYQETFKPIYEREIRLLADGFKSTVSGGRSKDDNKHVLFNEAFNRVLSVLIPVVLDEQDFIRQFFGFERPNGQEDAGPNDAAASEAGAAPSETGTSTPEQAAPQHGRPASTLKQEPDDEITPTEIMRALFGGLQELLTEMVDLGHKLDPFNAVCMVVQLDRHANETVGADSVFLRQVLATTLIWAKRFMDGFVESTSKAIDEAKTPKKSKVGILPFVSNFAKLIRRIEEVAGKTKRRALLDKAYKTLIDTVYATVERVAGECKLEDVVIFENFHQLYDQMSRLKVDCLKPYRPIAQDKYRQHRDTYVQSILGKPMEKLSIFFEGVERLMRSGMAANEVGYQLDFSKQELKKCIREYPGPVVKKGLEQIYKKVQKHLSDEEALTVVVWRSVQEEFVKRYEHFDKLIQDCYPGAQLALEFDVSDLLTYFSSMTE